MEIFGIHFAPLFIPLSRRLETLSILMVMFLFVYLFPVSIGITISLMFSQYWWMMALYMVWIMIDRKIGETGGRTVNWVGTWRIFEYARRYYPISLTMPPGLKLNPKRSYMACSFPHGQYPIGVPLAFCTDTPVRRELCQSHSIHPVTLNINFFVPFYREFLLAIGLCSAKRESIDYILQTPGGGKIVTIVVGGAEESQYAFGGKYHLVLKKRKGFIKVALQNGASLIPIFSFGETSVFKQLNLTEGSLFRRFQIWAKKITGISFNIVYGRGIFQYTFGLLPLRHPIDVVVGDPIDVEKISSPTQEDIDSLHERFIEALTKLFEEHKHKFEKNPESSTLVIV